MRKYTSFLIEDKLLFLLAKLLGAFSPENYFVFSPFT